MQQGRSHGAHGDDAKQGEGRAGDDEVIQRIGRIDRRKGDGSAGRCEDRRNIGDGQRCNRRQAFLAAGEFADGEQRQREQPAEQYAHFGAEQAGLNGIADHEEAAERQCEAADPDHPARADAFLEAGASRRGFHRRDGFGRSVSRDIWLDRGGGLADYLGRCI